MGVLMNLALLAVLVATLYGPVSRELTVLGVWRKSDAMGVKHSFQEIPDTMQCEDLHYHEGSGQIFTACEDSVQARFKWYPGLANLQGPGTSTGSIHVINPKVHHTPGKDASQLTLCRR